MQPRSEPRRALFVALTLYLLTGCDPPDDVEVDSDFSGSLSTGEETGDIDGMDEAHRSLAQGTPRPADEPEDQEKKGCRPPASFTDSLSSGAGSGSMSTQRSGVPATVLRINPHRGGDSPEEFTLITNSPLPPCHNT